MDKTIASSWQESLTQTYRELISQLVANAPQVVAAIALLLLGLMVSHLLRVASRRLISSLDVLFHRAARVDGTRQEKIKVSYAVFISRIVFWTTMVFFVAATAHMLGWQLFSSWMNSVISYLPNLITGVLIILTGFLLGNGARAGITSAAHTAGVERGEVLARLAQAVIFLTTVVIGIEQIGINVHFLSDTIVVALGVLLAGSALAFGLGAKTLIANIIGAQYLRRHCQLGERMRMDGVDGTVVEVTQTSIVLETESGRTVIPAKFFQEQVIDFSPGSEVPTRNEADSAQPGAQE